MIGYFLVLGNRRGFCYGSSVQYGEEHVSIRPTCTAYLPDLSHFIIFIGRREQSSAEVERSSLSFPFGQQTAGNAKSLNIFEMESQERPQSSPVGSAVQETMSNGENELDGVNYELFHPGGNIILMERRRESAAGEVPDQHTSSKSSGAEHYCSCAGEWKQCVIHLHLCH